MTLRILICEDNRHLIADYRSLLDATEECLVVGTATSARAAVELLRDKPADVLIVDLGLPDLSGIEVIRAMRRVQPACEALVVTVFGDEDTVLGALEAGAAGYVLKDALDKQLLKCVRDLAQGGSPISPSIARLLLNRLPAHRTPAEQTESESLPFAWSARENDVLNMISKGYSLQEVGDMLHLSVNTIKTHVRRIYKKLAVSSRSEAIYEARALGLLDRSANGPGDRSS
jgi:DNA-binding NarL/FixJ family response regulator